MTTSSKSAATDADHPMLVTITFEDLGDGRTRLVYDHSGDDPDEAPFRGSVNLYDEGPARTRLVMRTLFPSSAVREMVTREYHAVEGGIQTLDRLAAYLAQVAA